MALSLPRTVTLGMLFHFSKTQLGRCGNAEGILSNYYIGLWRRFVEKVL